MLVERSLQPIERKPSKEFRGTIEKFWLFPRRGGGDGWFLESPPDGNFVLVFVLGETGCRLLYVGPFTELRYLPLQDRYDYLCVRFSPGIMPRVADIAARDLVDTWAVLPKVLGKDVDELGERLIEASGLSAKQRVVEDFFRESHLESVIPDGLYFRSVQLVQALGGRIRVDGLANTLSVSARTLERMFREQAGVTPKQFIRLVRFQNILEQLHNGVFTTTLADVAQEWGYVDQSHFINDFRKLAKRPPGRV